VDSTGDNLLAEFASVVDAVQAAVEIQQVLKAKNSLLPENRRMEFRIGINLGDVIEEGERIFGDGVNIAARLEGIAEAGGICISGSAFEQIENKLPLHYDYLGEHEVKNITRPVRVYRALMDNGGVKAEAVKPKEKGPQRKILVFCLAGALILISGVALWQFVQRPPSSPPPVASKTVEKADPLKMAYALPDKPSIAVLPFMNMSDDREQEYFADGLAEEIINALSKVDQIFVIARNSTFYYKGKPVRVQQVAEDLGVRYVLEGSVRKSGETVRVTAQLVDALNGRHILSESYDRDFKDILSVQDEITMNILSALQVAISKGEFAQTIAKGTKNLKAYLKTMQAHQFAQQFNKEAMVLSRRCADEDI
jgi:TolB-like protein